MESLTKDINNIENAIAKYIFIKYIQPDKNKTRLDASSKDLYKKYVHNIFEHKRECYIIDQFEAIRQDLKTMAIADAAYERNPKEFHCANFDIPPDVLRCTFIRKHHHRYYRCKHRISNDDSDVCKKHENSENIYYDKYNDILEQLT